MPIYEYQCEKCRKVSSFLVRSVDAHESPACPKCGGKKMDRVFSRFATTGRGAKSKATADPGPGGPPMGDDLGGGMGGMDEGMGDDMPDLSELEGLDENDPRSLGRIMRKMADKAGEPLDPEMDEVCRRLESGEDPESIEEKMGDALGGEGGEEGGGGDDDTLYDA
jgi:putative FmdB family regulatory protein